MIDLAQLRSGRSIENPFTKERVNPAQFIVLEEPFGRTRKGMKELVDFVACIDVSPDLALARHLLRDIAFHKTHADPEKILNWAMKRLEGYLEKFGRAVFLKVNELAMSDCDIILDGEKPVEESAQKVAEIVLAKVEEAGS